MSEHHETYRVTVYGDDPNRMKIDAAAQAKAFYGPQRTAEIIRFAVRPLRSYEKKELHGANHTPSHLADVVLEITGNDVFRPGPRATRQTRYAYDVLDILVEQGGFDRWSIAPFVIESLVNQFLTPDEAFEFVVDHPCTANWKLHPAKERGYEQFVRLACCKPENKMSSKDRERESVVNDRLSSLVPDYL